MRVQLSFALVFLLACSADDGGIGQDEKIFRADPAAEDASTLGTRDASPAKQDGAVSTDAAVSEEDATVSEDAGLQAEDAGLVEDAGPGEEDAGFTSTRCGTRGGVTCKGNEYCDFAGDPQCGATDKGGVCKPKPKPTKELAPVCGCDKRSYDNASMANAAGVSVLHTGSCTPDECTAAGGTPLYSNGANVPVCDPNQESWPIVSLEPAVCCLGKGTTGPGICGGFAGFACAKGQFCDYALGDGCLNIADGAGKCAPIPEACLQVYQPVCGCDGKTYSNACTAHGSGISVKLEGACK